MTNTVAATAIGPKTIVAVQIGHLGSGPTRVNLKREAEVLFGFSRDKKDGGSLYEKEDTG